MIIDIVSAVLLAIGSFLSLTSAWGLIRFPDFYSRVHAASISDTLCAACFIFALVLQAGWSLLSIKLLIVLGLLWLTSPTSSHALVKAAHFAGLRALTHNDGKKD